MKPLIKSFIVVCFLSSVFLPNVTYAAKKTEDFCSAFITESQTINLKLESKQAEILSKNDEKQLQIKNAREKRQAELDALRALAGERVNTRLDGIEKLAKTKAQKQAVIEFKTQINQAVKIRKTEIDTALKTFQEGLDTALKNYQTQIQTALANYKNALAEAENKAKQSCAGKTNPNIVKNNFNSRIQSAQEVFKSDRGNLSEQEKKLSDLKNSRNSQVSQADETFKNSVNSAAAKLKTELSKK